MRAPPFALGAILVVGIYLLFTLGVGLVARRARRSESLSDFYLAGRNLGGLVLFFTLYATQYSGNALLGFPGEAYRLGFAMLMTVGFTMAIVVVYLLFAPQLRLLAKRHAYVTPGDWLDHRFGSPALSLVANGLMAVAVANYLLAQLMAMGHVIAGVSDGAVPYWMGVVALGLVIIVYETLGGLRAVAWTDCLQGMMLLVGLGGLLFAVAPTADHLRATTEWILQHQPQKVVVPPRSVCVNWLSTVLLMGFSVAVYPHAIQRIYAARDLRALKRSLSMMAFMPLVTMPIVVMVGVFGIERLDTLRGVAADQVMPLLLREWAAGSLWMYALAMAVVAGIVAAIMSTADSALLSLSSILAKDFVGKTLLPDATEVTLTRLGKALSWAIMVVLVGAALSPRITLWGLTELKIEILAQVSPLFVLGLGWRKLTAPAALAGMLVGALLLVGLIASGHGRIAGIHAGLIALAVNATLAAGLSTLPLGGSARRGSRRTG